MPLQLLFSENLYNISFQFLYTIWHSNDVSLAIDKKEGAVGGAVLLEHSEFIIEVNEAGPRVDVALDGFAHGICRFELMGETEHVQTSVVILVV